MARERKVVLEMHIPSVKTGRKRLALPDAIPAVEVSITPTKDSKNVASKIVDNFWRALKSDPDAVADACDWPVNETDLHSRHILFSF
jgi:hypothetical protein